MLSVSKGRSKNYNCNKNVKHYYHGSQCHALTFLDRILFLSREDTLRLYFVPNFSEGQKL